MAAIIFCTSSIASIYFCMSGSLQRAWWAGGSAGAIPLWDWWNELRRWCNACYSVVYLVPSIDLSNKSGSVFWKGWCCSNGWLRTFKFSTSMQEHLSLWTLHIQPIKEQILVYFTITYLCKALDFFLTDFEFKLKRSLCVVQVFLNAFRARRLFMAFKLASSTTASHSDRTQSIANLATEGHGFVNWDSRTSTFLMRPDALKLMKEFGFPFGEPRPKRVCVLEVCWSYDEWQVKHFGQRCSFETWILGSRVKGPLCEVQEARQEGQKGPQEGLGLPTDASLQQPVLAEAIASTCRRAPFLQSRLLVADSPKQIDF